VSLAEWNDATDTDRIYKLLHVSVIPHTALISEVLLCSRPNACPALHVG